jgi:hypothetical protein
MKMMSDTTMVHFCGLALVACSLSGWGYDMTNDDTLSTFTTIVAIFPYSNDPLMHFLSYPN